MAPKRQKSSKASNGMKKMKTDSGAINTVKAATSSASPQKNPVVPLVEENNPKIEKEISVPNIPNKVKKGRKRKPNEDVEQEAQVVQNVEKASTDATGEKTGRRGRSAKKLATEEDASKTEETEVAQPAAADNKAPTQEANNSQQNGDKVASGTEKTEEKTTRRGRPAKASKEKSTEKNVDAASEEVQTAKSPDKNGVVDAASSSAAIPKGKSSKKINASEALKRLEEAGATEVDNNEEGEEVKTTDSDFGCDLKTKDGRTWNLKISCWNVGGLRAWLKKKCQDYVEKENPDIFLVQETKISESDLTDEMKNIAGYTSYFQHTDTTTKKGYAGVAMYTKIKPIKVTFGIGNEKFDGEGRLITAEFEKFYLVNAYVPNSSRGLVRLPFRQEWNKEFFEYIKKLDAEKPVIYCGDLNVAHNEIDLANPQTNKKNAGFTKEEREDFTLLLNNGFTDAFRLLYPKKSGAYTFWSNMNKARERNIGWRLDYFLVSKRLEKDICEVAIRSHVMGSDHCPLTLFAAI